MTKSCFQVDIKSFDQFVKNVQEDPDNGKISFKTTTEWQGGAVSKTKARDFVIKTDEPDVLGGTDTGADPVELLLASISTCLSIGLVTQAAKRDIDFEDFVIETEGDLDLRGYFNLDENVRPGYTDIRYNVKVKSDATQEQLDEIKDIAHRLSPMVETVVNGVNVQGSIEQVEEV